jgi:small subunit ribosomal protein S21
VQIFVRDNNVDQALKALKKKMQREGTFREMKRHVHYEKPSEKRRARRPRRCAAPASWLARRPSARAPCPCPWSRRRPDQAPNR